MTYDASSNDSDDSSKDNNSPKVCINNNRIPSRNWQSPVRNVDIQKMREIRMYDAI